jgi:hypothetical protein
MLLAGVFPAGVLPGTVAFVESEGFPCSVGFFWLMMYHIPNPQMTIVASIPIAISTRRMRSVSRNCNVISLLRVTGTGAGTTGCEALFDAATTAA